MLGGKGQDRFVYKDITESLAFKGLSDMIFGFQKKDKIDLKKLNKTETLNKSETLTFIESEEFNGLAGEVRFNVGLKTSSLQLDSDGDGSAEFEILMPKTIRFTEANLIF